MEIMLLAGFHKILLKVDHHLFGFVILIACLIITGSFHELPSVNIKLPQTVKNYMDMDIP